MESSEADVMSQVPKPIFVADVLDGKEAGKVSQSERASTRLSKNKKAKH